MKSEPRTLQEAIIYFADAARCREYVVARRWPNGIACPRCGSLGVTFQPKHNRWQCSSHHDRRQFTLKTGTVFEDSPLGLDKWLCAMWMVVNCKNGVSSYEIHRAIGVTQKTAWFMLSRLRLVLQDRQTGGKLGGDVEVDETFIGGRARNMHASKRRRLGVKRGMNPSKVAVMGLLERHSGSRHSRVRAMVVPDTKRERLHRTIKTHVEDGTRVYTDEFPAYAQMPDTFEHNVIKHAESYVDGQVHTNGIENFWSLLKRTLGGTYVSVEPFHLFRYIDEQAFRFNERGGTDSERFHKAVAGVVGRRLTFAELTAANASTESVN